VTFSVIKREGNPNIPARTLSVSERQNQARPKNILNSVPKPAEGNFLKNMMSLLGKATSAISLETRTSLHHATSAKVDLRATMSLHHVQNVPPDTRILMSLRTEVQSETCSEIRMSSPRVLNEPRR
jgi:hypothetical protein